MLKGCQAAGQLAGIHHGLAKRGLGQRQAHSTA
jgi:hypothetical protein